MLLADQKPSPMDPYATPCSTQDSTGAILRMARLYYDRYPWTLDWSNVHGKTALHIAAIRGNEELVRVCYPSPALFTYHLLTFMARCYATLRPTSTSPIILEILRFTSEYPLVSFFDGSLIGSIARALGVTYLYVFRFL